MITPLLSFFFFSFYSQVVTSTLRWNSALREGRDLQPNTTVRHMNHMTDNNYPTKHGRIKASCTSELSLTVLSHTSIWYVFTDLIFTFSLKRFLVVKFGYYIGCVHNSSWHPPLLTLLLQAYCTLCVSHEILTDCRRDLLFIFSLSSHNTCCDSTAACTTHTTHTRLEKSEMKALIITPSDWHWYMCVRGGGQYNLKSM